MGAASTSSGSADIAAFLGDVVTRNVELADIPASSSRKAASLLLTLAPAVGVVHASTS